MRQKRQKLHKLTAQAIMAQGNPRDIYHIH